MRTALNPLTKRLTNRRVSNPALQIKPEFLPDLVSVTISDVSVNCLFDDGRSVSFPISWSEKLTQATAEQRQNVEFNAHFIFWNSLDEIIGVRNILFGKRLRWE